MNRIHIEKDNFKLDDLSPKLYLNLLCVFNEAINKLFLYQPNNINYIDTSLAITAPSLFPCYSIISKI